MAQKFQPGGRAGSIPLMDGHQAEPTIFELSVPGRSAASFRTTGVPFSPPSGTIPSALLRDIDLDMPEVSERDLVAHFTRLTHRQFSVDLGAYPLGSCTMKYNPKFADIAATAQGLTNIHPCQPESTIQGWLELMTTLEHYFCEITGMAGATLQPAAGAQGELTGLLIMKAYHKDQGRQRKNVIIPDSAHGTNPASVTLSGYTPITVKSGPDGLIDLTALKGLLDEDTAGIMLTNPNTLGLFEREILEISTAVHGVGGLLYYDGANLNAVMGIVRPGDMGFDIVHSNLHKTFATPHGGGGPGSGPVAVSNRLLDFLPGPKPAAIGENPDGSKRFGFVIPEKSIGRIHSFHGNSMVLVRALAYMMYYGGLGLTEVSQIAVLNANWLRKRISAAYPSAHDEICMHEFVASAAMLKKKTGIRGLDVAKKLLEFGIHAPTVYFPLVVEEALMFEPTETESLQTLGAIADALDEIAELAQSEEGRNAIHQAPTKTPVTRLDEARAARTLISTFDASIETARSSLN
ncbi:MAG: aminomethyl-transferring glycine dehydrogenase subunit GcvPB [Actinomycetota bacterium]|nr:aminomethyl-transferring glycine dehydrogenase subunit GcvPB [Actinomycetota bacterium]